MHVVFLFLERHTQFSSRNEIIADVKARLDALKRLWYAHGRDALEAGEVLSHIDKTSADDFKEHYETISEYVHAENYAISHLIWSHGATFVDGVRDWDLVLEYESELYKYNDLYRLQKTQFSIINCT